MGNKTCELKVSIEILSFFNHTIEFTKEIETLDRIDQMTYSFDNSQSYFDYFIKMKSHELRFEFERDNGYSPTGYLLGENGIYILKNNRKIRALFKNIQIGNREYSLEELILSWLYSGNLTQLYLCDKFRSSLGEYDSIFRMLNKSYIEKMELGVCDAQDIRIIWDSIKKSRRRYIIMRFLLRDLNKYEGNLNELFYDEIPAKENYRDIDRETSKFNRDYVPSYKYRVPYKDN